MCIALACTDFIKSKTTFSLVHAVQGLPFEVDMLMNISCDIIGQRTWLVREALKRGSTHILMVDSDMFFPIEDGVNPIQRLVSHDKDIIGGWYNFRRLPAEPVGFPRELHTGETEPFKCDVVGTGFLLVKREVFEKIPEPWFQFGRDKEQQLVYGEDSWFCDQARKVGFDVWADPGLFIKHIGEFAY